jgi:hypothetical protein
VALVSLLDSVVLFCGYVEGVFQFGWFLSVVGWFLKTPYEVQERLFGETIFLLSIWLLRSPPLGLEARLISICA